MKHLKESLPTTHTGKCGEILPVGVVPACEHFSLGLKIGFAKGEALRILKTTPTRSTFK